MIAFFVHHSRFCFLSEFFSLLPMSSPPDFAVPANAAQAKLSAPIDVLRVRELFSRPQKVAASNFLRREVATRMHERLALIKLDPARVLDVGCGEGADLPLLQQRFAQAQVFGLDGAQPMLARARQDADERLPRLQRWIAKLGKEARHGLLAGDFASLPLASSSIDALWSNLALHWHPQPDMVLCEWQRVLRVNGLLMFSCFGPDTFQQLRNALQQVGLRQSVLPFVDMHDFGDMLVRAGFATPVMDMERVTVTYRTVQKLLADVRSFGGNPLSSRQKTGANRRIWQDLQQVLEAMRGADGVIPLTFEIIYGHAFKPQPKTAGEAVIRFERMPKNG